MPRVAKELSPIEVKRLKHPGDRDVAVRIAVGGVSGLHMQITPSGSRSWMLRLTVGGARRELGLGSFPEVGLADARTLASEAKAKARDGIDPVQERKDKREAAIADKRRALTFGEAIEGYMVIHKSQSEKNRKVIRKRLHSVGLSWQRVGDIDKHAVKKVLEPIWLTKPATASHLRADMKNVFDWARGNDHMDGPNPAEWKGNLEYMLPPQPKDTTHRPAVALQDAARFMAALRERGGYGSRALEFLVLTAARSGEVRGARWSEIDFDRSIWIVPAKRMKMGKEHRVPLSAAALTLLEALPRESELIFPAPRGGALHDVDLSAIMKGMKGFVDVDSRKPAVPHGWRSTFRDWAAEVGYPSDLAEAALAHQVGSAVERAYRRTDVLERRRTMMDAWAAYLDGAQADENVVALHG